MTDPARARQSPVPSPARQEAASKSKGTLTVRLLGQTSFFVNGVEVELANRKSRSLLACLCLSETGSETRERLVSVLWSEAEPRRARASLRQAIYEVRTHLVSAGFDGFANDNLSVRLDVSNTRCDVWDILAALDVPSVHAQLLRREQTAHALLEDLDSTDPAFSTWLLSQRELLRRRLVLGLERMLEGESIGAAFRKEVPTALLNLDQAHELAVRELMRLYQAEHNHGAALEVYKRLWDHLDAEFDVEPTVETQSLAAEIKLAETAIAPPLPRVRASSEPPARPLSETPHAQAVAAFVLRSPNPALQNLVQDWISRRFPAARVCHGAQGDVFVSTDRTSDAARIGLAMLAPQTLAALSVQPGDIRVGLHFVAKAEAGGEETAAVLARHGGADHVVASEAARERLVEGLDALIRDLGYIGVDGIGRLRGFMLVAPDVAGAPGSASLQSMQPTIAVIPVLLADGGPMKDVVSVLASEELSHELSTSQMVDLISPLSSRRLAGRAIMPEEIGKRLGADYLILVEFQERGTGSQVNVELVDACNNVVKWQQRAELSSLATDHIKAAMERIAHECLAALFVAQLAHASSAPLASLDSYKLLFSAIALMDRWTRSSFHRAHEHLAILRQRAPLHHWPNAWLSAWHIRSISQGWSADPIGDGKAAIEHARMALDSNASCSLAIAMEGWANVYGSRRLDLAIERMQFAVEVNHSDSLAWLLKGITHAFINQPAQAVEAVERALKLSPIDPRRSYYEALAAGAFAATDDHARTIELAQSSLRANRLHASPLRALAAAQWYSGQEEEARNSVKRLIEIEPKFTVDQYLRQHPAADSRYGRRIADALRSAGAP